ncbi:putative extracellular mutant protein [Septoria linicola]|nr:putative extracellular mutant protein [Septoria linicola]
MAGVTNFVHRQNGVSQYDGTDDAKQGRRKSNKASLQDLKVKLPDSRPSTPTARARANSHKARGGRHAGPETRSRSQAGTHVGPNGGFLDTDASDADRTSGPGSVHQVNQDIEPNLSLDQQNAFNQQNTAQPQTFAGRRVSGDSYPATTSGQLSEVDMNAAYHPLQSAQTSVQDMQGVTSSMPTRGVGGTRGLPAGMTAPVAPQPQNDPRSQGQANPGQGFQYGPPPSYKPNMARSSVQQPQAVSQPQRAQQSAHHPQRQQISHQPAYQQQQHQHLQYKQLPPDQPAAQQPVRSVPATTQLKPAAAPDTPVSDGQELIGTSDKHSYHHSTAVPLGNVTNQYRTPEDRRVIPLSETDDPKRDDDVQASEQEQPRSDMQAGSDHLHSGPQFQTGIHSRGPEDMIEDQTHRVPAEQPQSREPSPELDIFPPELYKKDYSDIKAQPFDIDPYARPVDLPQDVPTNTLQDKLLAVMPMEAQGHMDFLVTLTAEQWEDAGDWFIERFGALVGKLKDSRKEKRKAARAFEDEIEQRHEAISKKQKLTLSALSEMKESGGKVLQGTPKKSGKAMK